MKKLKIKLQLSMPNLHLKIIKPQNNKQLHLLNNKLSQQHKNPYNKKLKPLFNNLQFNHPYNQLNQYNNNLHQLQLLNNKLKPHSHSQLDLMDYHL